MRARHHAVRPLVAASIPRALHLPMAPFYVHKRQHLSGRRCFQLSQLPMRRFCASGNDHRLIEHPRIITQVSDVLHPKDVHKSNWVSDPHGYLSNFEDRRAINATIDKMHSKYGVEVAVVLIDACAVDSRLLLHDVFNEWGIGCETVSNGVLLAMVMGKHRLEVVTGDGLDTTALDKFWLEQMHEGLMPQFNDGAVGQGLALGLEKISERLDDWPDKSFVADWLRKGSANSGQSFSGGVSGDLAPADLRFMGPERAVMILLGAGLCAASLLYIEDKIFERDKKRCPECGEWKLERHNEIVKAMTCDPWEDGCKCEHIVCRVCGYHGKMNRIVPAAHNYTTTSIRLKEPSADSDGLEQINAQCQSCFDTDSSERVIPRPVKRRQHAGI